MGLASKRLAGVEVKLDGREICDLTKRAGKREYKIRTLLMWHRQDGICPACGKRIAEDDATFDHEVPRGMDGAFRDDRIEIERNGVVVWQNQCLHFWCNVKKGSRRDYPMLRQGEFFTEIGVDRNVQATDAANSGSMGGSGSTGGTDEEGSSSPGDGGGDAVIERMSEDGRGAGSSSGRSDQYV
jgi:hypothetical protein